MDKYTMIVALSGQICGMILIVSLVNAVVRYRRRGVAAPGSDGLQRIETRLAEMQEAIDAVAVEVERISEAQRFTTKLLADRGEIALDGAHGLRAGGRVTPSR